MTESPVLEERGDVIESDQIKPDQVIIRESVETFPELSSLELARQTEEQISSKDTFSENNPNITLASHEETFISDVEPDENLNENVLEHEASVTELPQDIDGEQTTVLFEDEEKSETDERPLSGSMDGEDLNDLDRNHHSEKESEMNGEVPTTMKIKAEERSREKINIDHDVIDPKENNVESRQVHADFWENEVLSVDETELPPELMMENEVVPDKGTILIAPETLTKLTDNIIPPPRSDQASDGSSQNNVIVPRAETQLQENLILDWISEEREVSNLTSEISSEKPMPSVTEIQGIDLLVNITTPVSLKVTENPDIKILRVEEAPKLKGLEDSEVLSDTKSKDRKYKLMDPAFHQPIPIIGNREYLGLVNQNTGYGTLARNNNNINTQTQSKHEPQSKHLAEADNEAFNEIKDIFDDYKKKKILASTNSLWDTELSLTFNITEKKEDGRKKRKIESFIPPAPVRDNNRQLIPRVDPNSSPPSYSAPSPSSSSLPDSCFTATACSSSCGTGFQLLLPDKSSALCQEAVLRVMPCTIGPCPVHCAWAAWSSWTSCSQTDDSSPECSQGRRRQVQRRQSAGGRACTGDFSERRFCVSQDCQGETMRAAQLYIKNNIFHFRLPRGGGASWDAGL